MLHVVLVILRKKYDTYEKEALVTIYEDCPESIGPTFLSPRWRYSSSSGG